MEEIGANVGNVVFDIEVALDQQLGAMPLPFPGMDKSGAAVCTFYMRGSCTRGAACPSRHVGGYRTVVCKHWLRGLCKMGDECEFLHEFDMTKMPECYFYARFNACTNKACLFQHTDPDTKARDCLWYDRGFCHHGPKCIYRHTRRVLCTNYRSGFCPDGSECKFTHPKFDLPLQDRTQQVKRTYIVCRYCGKIGHKAVACLKMPDGMSDQTLQPRARCSPRPNRDDGSSTGIGGRRRNRPRVDEVTCYKCGEKGHYASKCPKGHLAFLSSALLKLQTQ